VIQRLISCVCLLPVLAFAEDGPLTVADIPARMKTDGLWQPVLPPTSAEGADALDRQVYLQFANDELHLANGPGASRIYALMPHGSLVGYYDDNINLSHTHAKGDLALAAEPGLTFGVGDFQTQQSNFLIADYTGRWTSFWDHTSADAYEQFATLRAQFVTAKWKLNTNFTFLDLDDVDIDSGARTSRQIYDTVQVASYELSEKDFVELQAQNTVREYELGAGSVEWQGRGFYNYRWDPKLTLGGGFAGGTLNIDGSPGQTYEQVLLRGLYDPTAKISIQAQGGLEVRQLENGQEKVTPVLDLNGDYRARAGTDINLNVYRRIEGSNSFANRDYTATGFGISAAQEMGIKWLATLKAGYENNSYFTTNTQEAFSVRADNFFYISPTVQYRLDDHTKIEGFYNYRRNQSNNSDRSFGDNQIGLRASFIY
jgi:hypothetical protein